MTNFVYCLIAIFVIFIASLLFPLLYITWIVVESFQFFTGYFRGVNKCIRKHLKGGACIEKSD